MIVSRGDEQTLSQGAHARHGQVEKRAGRVTRGAHHASAVPIADDDGGLSAGRCIHELFEARADQWPSNVAISFEGEDWTYQEVESHANQLARYLRARGVGRGATVGVYFYRSEKPIISVLAILKAGAAYVPIDATYPPERVRHIVAEADMALLLTERELSETAMSVCPDRSMVVDFSDRQIAAESATRLSGEEVGVLPNDLSYILFTSGTTGRPKGVMIEHRNVVGFITGWNQVTQIGPDDRIYHGFSLGFDASVEELWMAFSNGAALVVAPLEVVRVPDEVADFIEKYDVTVISTVPTFLAVLDPDLPTVRIVISGGEPCPPEVVRRWWRPGRRVFNTYGPTETTVDATFVECSLDRPVTIGRPLPGYKAYVLDENLQQLPVGEPGELCIGGVAVARGYLNQPELTNQRFVPNPFCEGNGSPSRLYRSGDLVRWTADGEIDFLGRIDRQVKIRGFRIELPGIESVLHEDPQIQQAVVEVVERQGLKEIAAYVVPRPHVNGSFDRGTVLRLLRDRLPAYMVPGYLDLIDSIPVLPSGKIDRSSLPPPRTPLVSTSQTVIAPQTDLERKIVTVWQTLFQLVTISCESDFFLDLGGHSLLAAEMVSLLRGECGLEVAIRDVYEHPTVQKLANHVAAAMADQARTSADATAQAAQPSSREVIESVPRLTRWTCYSLQALSLVLGYGLVTAPFLVLMLLILGVIHGSVSLSVLIIYMVVMSLLSLPVSIGISILLKWLIIRRYRPGRYPLWGFYYFRWWLATRVQSVSGIVVFEGTPIMSLYYRLMGAKVGKNCLIDTSLCAIYDLLTIGDDTCIGSRTQLLGYHVDGGMLTIGTVEIGSRCFIGSHSAIGVNAKLGDDARLDDLSLLPDGAVMSAGESRRGSPAEPAEVSLPEIDEAVATERRPFLYGVLYFLASEIVGDLMLLTLVPPLLIIAAAYLYLGVVGAVVTAYVTVPINLVAFCLISAGVKAFVMRRTRPGVYPVESFYFLRKWLVDIVFRASGRVMYAVYATIYLPPWLRLLGARVGRRAEIAMVGQMTPDLTDIGDESFFADGATIGGRRYFRGHVELGVNRIGRRTFVGNSSMLSVGTSIGDNSLLGVMSTAPGGAGSTIPDDTEWLGSPPFRLPYRKAVAGFDVAQTYCPTVKLYVLRYLIDAVRILLPFYIGLTGLLLFGAFALFGIMYLPTWSMFALLPLVSTTIAFTAAMAVVVVKKLLIGTFVPVVKPLWSVYVWFNEVINGSFETIGAPVLTPMMGTPFFSWYLRLLGCTIGKHAFIQTTYFSEFDLVEIGDYVALNYSVVVQNHLFEDRIMKSSYLKIGDGCSVGNMSVVLYDTEMQEGSSIGSLSLLMKGETVAPNTRWLGIPTRQV
jgi:non-ribosomal peptide synthetase-like protein